MIERNEGFHFSWRQLQIFAGGQLGYLSPLALAAALYAMVSTGVRGIRRRDRGELFLFSVSVPYVLLFMLPCALSPTAKPHWTVIGYLAALLWLPQRFERARAERRTPGRRAIMGFSIAAVAVSVLFSAALFAQSVYPIVKMKPRLDATNELYGWPAAGRAVSAEVNRIGMQGEVAIATGRYNMASQVCFYTREHFPAYSFSSVHEQHDFWHRGSPDSLRGKAVLFVGDNRYDVNPARDFVFDRIDTLPPIETRRAGRTVRVFQLYRCYGFHGQRP